MDGSEDLPCLFGVPQGPVRRVARLVLVEHGLQLALRFGDAPEFEERLPQPDAQRGKLWILLQPFAEHLLGLVQVAAQQTWHFIKDVARQGVDGPKLRIKSLAETLVAPMSCRSRSLSGTCRRSALTLSLGRRHQSLIEEPMHIIWEQSRPWHTTAVQQPAGDPVIEMDVLRQVFEVD